jgi:biotin synthase
MTTSMLNHPYSFEDALARAQGGHAPEVAWVTRLLVCSDAEAPRLYAAANAVREAHVGDDVHLRGLIEFSNICRKDCTYCGLRRSNRGAERFRLTPATIVRTARHAAELGYRSVVLQSGEDAWFTPARLADIVRRIKAQTDLAITLSAGERDRETYRLWREAGADRYLLRIETTDPALFAALHPDAYGQRGRQPSRDGLEERKQCLYDLRDLGYQLGTGVMVGLPGQTAAHLARDVVWMHELGAEMIGVGPFIPHPDTPLAGEEGGTVEQTLRLVAVLRLVFPDAHLPATTAMGSLHPLAREQALEAGANVMMPNVSPAEARSKYLLYPGKICTNDDADHCRGCITMRIAAIGRTVGTTHGHVARVAQEKP